MKSIDEASKEFAKKWCLNYKLHEKIFRAGFVLCAKQFAQRWIPVEEELPENKSNGFSDIVLTKDKYENIKLERYDFEFKCFNVIRYDALVKGDGQVTHWRPIELK